MTTKQRLVMALAGAGVPVDRVTIDGNTADVAYMEWATQAQRDQGAAIVSAFDWSNEAQREWESLAERAKAKELLTAGEPMPRATRAACFALMLSLQEARAKINALIEAVNAATGAQIEILVTGSTFEDAMNDVALILDAGIA